MKRDLGFRYLQSVSPATRVLAMNLAFRLFKGSATSGEILEFLKALDGEPLKSTLSFLELYLENLLAKSLEN